MPEQIHRHALAPVQVRFAVDQEAGTFTGYAAVFNDLVPSYNERVLPGAFRRTLAERAARGDKLAILWAHDPREVIGVALSLVEDSYGLRVEGRLILDIARAAEAYTLIQEGIQSLSIGFWPVKWSQNDQGEYLIEDAELYEFSVVYAGASPRAKITEIRQQGRINPMPEPVVPETPATPAIAPDLSAIEARMAEMETTMQELEARAQRPGAPATARNPDDQAEREIRALATYLRTGSDVEMRAAASSIDPDGGWFILPTVDRTIRNLLADVSPLRQLAEVVTTSGNTFERYFSTGNRGAQWVGEKQIPRPQDTGNPALIRHLYGVMEMYAAPAGTRQLFTDASFDVANWFLTWAVNDFALTEGEAFLRGDGIDGKPRGLATYPIVATADLTRAWGEMQFLPAGHASAPTDDNWAKALVKLVLTVHPRYRANGAFVMHNSTLIRIREIQDSNKRFMWSDHGNLSESPESGYLLGYPVHIDNNMDEIGAGNHPVAFGDFRQGYTVVDAEGIKTERDGVTQKGLILLDTYKRVGGGLGDSNAIKWLKVVAS